MERFRQHPLAALMAALALSVAGAMLMALDAGFPAVGSAFAHFDGAWVGVVAAGQIAAIAGYVVAYRAIAQLAGGPRVNLWVATRLVVTGLGGLAPTGGLVLDRRALGALCEDERDGTIRVVGLGALEYAVLAPVACAAAIVLLVTGSDVMGGVLWPWALAVPPGLGLGLWLAAPSRCERLVARRHGRVRVLADRGLGGVAVLHRLASRPRGWAGFAGMAVYWAGEVLTLWGAVSAIGDSLPLGALILGLGTGYALTRRSMPFGGSGATEVLLTLALVWVGLPLAQSVAAMIVYRGVSFLLPSLPALAIRPSIEHLVLPGETPRPGGQRLAGA